jgi:hypothetical protein
VAICRRFVSTLRLQGIGRDARTSPAAPGLARIRHAPTGAHRGGVTPQRYARACGEPAKRLSPERTAKSRGEARMLPLYCVHCNPRFRFLDAVWSGLERMGD